MTVFFDYTHVSGRLIVRQYGEKLIVDEVYRLQGPLPQGSSCIIYLPTSTLENSSPMWVRKTVNEGSKGSTRYESFTMLEDALKSGILWGKRKVRETNKELALAQAKGKITTKAPEVVTYTRSFTRGSDY